MELLVKSSASSADAGTHAKLMRWPASLRLDHTTTLTGKTTQVSTTGISLMLSRSLRDNTTGLLSVNAFVNGSSVRLQARCTVAGSTCVGMEGFRISLRFQELDSDASNALEALLQAR